MMSQGAQKDETNFYNKQRTVVGQIGLRTGVEQALDESLTDVYTNGRKDKEPASGIAAKSFHTLHSFRRKLCLLRITPG